MEHTQHYPQTGWHEHSPLELWTNVVQCIHAVYSALRDFDASYYDQDVIASSIAAIGITNQRETTIAWNAQTGIPYYNAIVWDDLRTAEIASSLGNDDGDGDGADGNKDRFRTQTGLPLASYFAGTKVKWLIDHVPALAADLDHPEKRSQVRFGTVDTWLVHQLTGREVCPTQEGLYVGGTFVTDVSNASRWLFMDLHSCQWDFESLVKPICNRELPTSALPQIHPSSTIYGYCTCPALQELGLEKVPIAGILGDQQAALFGQGAFTPGKAKNTYGTGLFLMMNTGTTMTHSNHGLLTTVAYQLKKGGDVMYALEGSVSHSGSTIQWLRDQLQVIQSAAESETLAKEVDSTEGLYFVPAFAGLFAPYWRSDARACIVGMSASHTRNHIVRAALESTAYQTRDVFDAINSDSHVPLQELRVDGGGTANNLLMQFQANMINVPVVKPTIQETTALGAAFAAGLADGVNVWTDLEELSALWKEEGRFLPTMGEDEREELWKGWKKAIGKSMDWVVDPKKTVEEEDDVN